jgi:hypothetical protein
LIWAIIFVFQAGHLLLSNFSASGSMGMPGIVDDIV